MRILALFLLAPFASSSAAAEPPDFNRDVRPILAARCFKCHGPDDAARKGKLRLDTRAGAEAVLGKAETSEFLRRIFTDDESEVMPPPSVKVALTAREKETLKAWVAAGANYAPHWAFIAPRRPAVPGTQPNPIDAFIAQRLKKEGLKPSPEADRHTLIRRVYLDLNGIPPTPEEIEAFVKDPSPQAYEKLVDRLLASPRYGERWARKWLDLARYADTNGYEKDRQRSIWPYRDWVIRALNDDMPFDQFTIEQIAGDMLPGATVSQHVATGFHRNTMLNEEGGIDPLEFRYHAMTDRVATTGTVWLGLTLNCAMCHTHKFDPISQAEYYRLFAFLNNTDEPDYPVLTAEQQRRRADLLAQLARLEAEHLKKADSPAMRKALAAWIAAQRKEAGSWTVVKPATMDGGLSRLEILPDGSVFASGDTTKRDVYRLGFEQLPPGVIAWRLEAIPDERLPAGGPGRTYYEGPKGEFFLSEMTLSVGGKPVPFAGATESHAKDGGGARSVIDGNPLTGIGAGGRVGKARQSVFVLERPLSDRAATLELVFEKYYASSLGRFRVSVGTAAGARARDFPGEVEDALAADESRRTKEQHRALIRYWIETAPEFQAERAERDAIRKQLPAPPSTLVMQERPADFRRPTFRHHRGEFLQVKEKVEPGVPAVFPPLPAGVSADRLALARWLVARENPLTARVTVNRHWHAFFGRGLVRTVDDFGYQGDAPTHPELLDWLAVEFMEPSRTSSEAGAAGSQPAWSVKRLHRLIVTSDTYRQSSRVGPELLAKDPENKLLSRGSRVRLEAEQIRDSALQAAGLLSPKMYGPSVFPPQAPGVGETAYGGFKWTASTGEDRYRRGLYTFMKRTAPYAMAGTFDGPSGEVCLARREVTNSALQALTMLNDTVLLETARGIARRLLEQDGRTDGRVDRLFVLCLGRPPTGEERSRVAGFYESQRARFAADTGRAGTVGGLGPGAADERAAWTATARAILNLDEFVTRE